MLDNGVPLTVIRIKFISSILRFGNLAHGLDYMNSLRNSILMLTYFYRRIPMVGRSHLVVVWQRIDLMYRLSVKVKQAIASCWSICM